MSGSDLLKMVFSDCAVDSKTKHHTMWSVINLGVNPNDPETYLACAYAFSYLGADTRREAIVMFEKYFATNPKITIDHINHYSELGKLYESEYLFDKAELCYIRSAKIWPFHPNYKSYGPHANRRLGQLYLKQSTQKAIDYWRAIKTSDEYKSFPKFKKDVDYEYKNALEKHKKGYVYKPRTVK